MTISGLKLEDVGMNHQNLLKSNLVLGKILNEPKTIDENDNFVTFITTLDPRYKLPSRQTISTKIQEIYKEIEQRKNEQRFGLGGWKRRRGAGARFARYVQP